MDGSPCIVLLGKQGGNLLRGCYAFSCNHQLWKALGTPINEYNDAVDRDKVFHIHVAKKSAKWLPSTQDQWK